MDLYGDGGPESRHKRFVELHGDYVVVDGWLYFEDGAYRERSIMGGMWEPPTNDRERFKKMLFYHETKLKQEIKAFEEFKDSQFNDRDSWRQADASIRQLGRLKDAVDIRRKTIAELKEKINPTPKVDPELEAMEKRTEAKRAEYREKVKKFKV